MKKTHKVLISIFTALAFLLSILIPKVASANPWGLIEPPAPEEKITEMKVGDKAPYPGILFSVPAAAKIQVERETQAEKTQIAINKQVALEKAKYELLLANEKASKVAAQEQLKEIRKIKDEQLLFITAELEKQQKKTKRDLSPMWVAVGVVSGVVIVLASAYAIKQVGR